jgi:hypothetical protein
MRPALITAPTALVAELTEQYLIMPRIEFGLPAAGEGIASYGK